MENEKDRFGEKMRLVERAREDIYFAAKDRELIEKLKARLEKVEQAGTSNQPVACPKCRGALESYSFMDIFLDRCQACGGIWLDLGELAQILKKVSRSPLRAFVERFLAPGEGSAKEARQTGDRAKP